MFYNYSLYFLFGKYIYLRAEKLVHLFVYAIF